MNLSSLYYTGKGIQQEGVATRLPPPRPPGWDSPSKYFPDPGLVDAANVALMLRQPLILTGAPGTGKTQFASSLAWELGLVKPFKFETKSNSSARDLFYTYDALKRFQDMQSGIVHESLIPYIEYHALGKAILLARDWEQTQKLVGKDFPQPEKPTVSVVLIDEIDKAPRDFPNDILNEIERMHFHIPEMGVYDVKAEDNYRPIVVITSNSEKDLPDAFLRRCVYYNIPAPDRNRLREIVVNRMSDEFKSGDTFVEDVLELFVDVREAGNLVKPVSTAELLDWVLALKKMLPESKNPLAELAAETDPENGFESSRLFGLTQITLIKNTQDPDVAKDVIRKWLIAWRARANQK